MIWLVLSILISSLLFVIFKIMAKNNVNTLQTIVVNYTVCFIAGNIAGGHFLITHEVFSQKWFPYAVIQGTCFITVFYLMGASVRINGMAVASIANKLSLIIPACAGFYLYSEPFSWQKIAGLIIALAAIVMIVRRKEDVQRQSKGAFTFFLPFLVFIGGGITDVMTKYNQANFLTPPFYHVFLVCLFGVAALAGVCVLVFRYFRYGEKLAGKSILYGIMLGIPNYFSIYFVLRALNEPMFDSSTFFPVNNTGIVVFSCIIAILLFREKFTRLNLAGMFLAVFAIILMIKL